MELIKYIPGYRSKNIAIGFLATMYYLANLSFIVTSDGEIRYIYMALFGISLPFALCGCIDLFKRKYESNLKQEVLACILPIAAFLVSAFIMNCEGSRSTHIGRVNFLESNIRYYESKIEEFKEGEAIIKSGILIEQLKDEELISLEKENKELRVEIDEYKDELKNMVNAESTNDNLGSNYNTGNRYNENSNKHIGKAVFIASGNRYYHAISNCKYLEGAATSYITLTSSMNKFECNCWTNPVAYKPTTNNSSGSSTSKPSSGRTVYVAPGNSYYHGWPSCKFISGASYSAVSINNVGGKHPCNCIKY